MEELKRKLVCQPDFITLGGTGEPTLHARLDELIDAVQVMTRVPVAVLTNGSLLWDATIRKQLKNADVVIPSLDAPDELRFLAVNRPHREITFQRMFDGLVEFRQEYEGQLWLEIMLVGGYTALPTQVDLLSECVKQIQPDRVQLHTVTRPPSEDFAASVPLARLREFARMFDPPAEIVADSRRRFGSLPRHEARPDVLGLLRRRPATLSDIMGTFGLTPKAAEQILMRLEEARLVKKTLSDDRLFFRAIEKAA
jgi:wyosine [tRNA(Phe)-imidazoG37] synthetase (radical SAM superfamily)